MEVVAFIHAKSSSQRIANKNLRKLGKLPLFCHAINNALSSTLVSKVVIDSDSDEILRIGEEIGAIPLKRSSSLATNATTGDELMFWQASNYPQSEVVLQVVPTSPFIKPETIDKGIDLLLKEKVDSVVGVFEEKFYFWRDGRPDYFEKSGRIPNSFELEPVLFETTGLYINRTKYVLLNKRRINMDSCLPLQMSRVEAIDINVPEDFELAELVCLGLGF